MAVVPSLEEVQSERQTDRHPLLMEQSVNDNTNEHVIDIGNGDIAVVSAPDEFHTENRPASTPQAPVMPPPLSLSTTSNSRDVSANRRGDNYAHHHESPLNSGLWISIELVVNLSQIILAIFVLFVSGHEHPQAPLYLWIVGYTTGCFAALPLLCWRYIHRNNQESDQNLVSPRIDAFVDRYKRALDFFFAVWFVVGNVWVFGMHSSVSESPNLYRLSVMFLTVSCIGYAMPIILCTMVCCCLPCIISVMGFRDDRSQSRGATTDAISLLPTYKYKSKKSESGGDLESQGEGGILAAGTDKERTISAEDAVCCICLAKYIDGDDLRELLCTHFFHKECVDKWLKINALCPLCKSQVVHAFSASGSNSDRRQNDSRVVNGSDPLREVQSGNDHE